MEIEMCIRDRDIHESGFSRAVFPQQSMNFSLLHLKAHVIQNRYAEKTLADICHF